MGLKTQNTASIQHKFSLCQIWLPVKNPFYVACISCEKLKLQREEMGYIHLCWNYNLQLQRSEKKHLLWEMQRIIVNIEEGEHKVVSHKDKRCRGKWEKGVDRYL
jgi:hypothetical protein